MKFLYKLKTSKNDYKQRHRRAGFAKIAGFSEKGKLEKNKEKKHVSSYFSGISLFTEQGTAEFESTLE